MSEVGVTRVRWHKQTAAQQVTAVLSSAAALGVSMILGKPTLYQHTPPATLHKQKCINTP